MRLEDLTTELESKLYVEIIGRKEGIENYFKFATNEGYEKLDTFKEAKIKLDLLTELAEIIKNVKK